MKIRKAVLAFLAAICILASARTLGVFAEGTSRVYAETDASVEQGSYGYCYVYLDDLTDLASLNVAVYYDTERVTVVDSYNQVACSLYDLSNKNGCLQYSYIFDGEGSNTKTNLFYFCYQVNENAKVGGAYFDIVVTDAYNTAIESVDISGSRCNFTIAEKTVAKTAYVYGSFDIATSVMEEFEISYSLSDWQIASGSVVISYDPELFEFVEITQGNFLSGKLVDVNTSLKGSVYLSFLATEYNYSTDILKIKFRTLKNATENSDVKLTVSEFYDLERNRIVCDGYTTNVAITHDSTYTEDSPSVSLSASYDAQTDKVTVTVFLEKDSHLGAGDFVLNFDTNYLTYSSAAKGFSPLFFNVNDKNVGDGILKFSIISLTDITDGQKMLTVVFDVKHACKDKLVDVEISGSGLADSLTNPIVLNFVDTNVTVPLKHTEGTAVVENKVGASCTEDGHYDSVVYCSLCGEELSRTEKKIEKLGHDYTEQENNAIKTAAANCQEHNTYWYDCSRCGKSAKNDANATDKWYTSTEVGAHSYTKKTETDAYLKAEGTDCQTHHTYYFACEHCGASSKGDADTFYEGAAVGEHKMSADWISENGQHFHECTVDGCTHKEDTEACSGGTATCQTKAVCSTCGESYGELGEHDYDTTKWVSVDGDTHAHKCKLCDAYTDEAEHFSENEETCTEDKLCDACGHKMADAHGHSYTKKTESSTYLKVEGADCQTHHTYYYACVHCGVSSNGDTGAFYEGSAVGEHKMSQDWKTENGKHFHKCTVDGCDHVEDVASCSGGTATCQTLAKCSTCGQSYGELGDHDYDTTKWVSIDDTNHGHKCKLCNAYTDKTAHYSVDEETCTEDKICDACGHKMKDATGHTYKSIVTPPTCTERGYTTHTCHCGDSYVDTYVNATGHTYGEWTETKAPTCTEKGEERRDCKNCDHFETREIAATGHSHKSTVTPPTCTNQGYTTHTCHCGDSYVDTYVAATGHTYGDWTESKAPTCTLKGEERRDCKNCEHFEMREIAATRHSHKSTVTPPTCTNQGYTTHTCHCGDSYVDTYVAATGHTYGDWTESKAPTCTLKGEERRDCKNCEHFEMREIAATGHSHKSTVTPPTCTNQGYTTHTCHCGDSYVDTYVNATGHTYGEWTETKAPTCTEKGEEHRDCKNCEHFETREIAATGHSHKSTITPPTCTNQGYTTHTCHCGDSYVDTYVNATGHTYGEWTETKAPTCTEKGEERRDCKNCEHFETREIAAKDHSYVSVVTPPTSSSEGYTTHTCAVCGHSYTDNFVPKLEYILGDVMNDGTVTSDDAIYLLKHTLFPDMYPIDQPSDFDGNGTLDSDDAIYLLKHTLFPDMYPLNDAAVARVYALPPERTEASSKEESETE